jgi:hypothetical protein
VITRPFKITKFIAFEASGSDISNPRATDGYARHLAAELARVGAHGGTAHLTAIDLDDFAEWLDVMASANGSAGSRNYSGAASCARTAEKARAYARALREQEANNQPKEDVQMAAKVVRSKKGGTAAKKGGAAKKQASQAPAQESNGSNRRTQEDWDSLVNEIREARQAGETMQALKIKYGVGTDVPLREALARAGYNSKGEELEYEDLSDLKGSKLTARVRKEREQGTAWYMLALMTGKTEAELREVAGDVAVKRVASSSKAANGSSGTATATTKSAAKKGAGKKVARKGAKKQADPS